MIRNLIKVLPLLGLVFTAVAAADAEGNIVMITTTLLSRFGSRVLFPETGIMMNNGINWFDPRPGRSNSTTALRAIAGPG